MILCKNTFDLCTNISEGENKIIRERQGNQIGIEGAD
jgi:hypothetical protein